MRRIRVAVHATDPLSHAGLVDLLESCPQFLVSGCVSGAEADVVVLSTDQLKSDVVDTLRRVAAEANAPVVLITDEVDENHLSVVVRCHVVAILPRPAISAERLGYSVITAASRAGVRRFAIPGALLTHFQQLRRDALAPRRSNRGRLTPREVDVLRLLATGLNTLEIAEELCYSERTVKNIIYTLTRRLHLRSRPHAVAYALRIGAI